MSPRESAPKQTGGAVRRGARKVGVFKLVEGRRRHLIGPAPPGMVSVRRLHVIRQRHPLSCVLWRNTKPRSKEASDRVGAQERTAIGVEARLETRFATWRG
jgi:hypothetical protein